MKMLTLKFKPRTMFGIVLALTGLVVIAITFVSNHFGANTGSKQISAIVSASTDEERRSYLNSLGWELTDEVEEKSIQIPEKWNKVYNDYNELQLNQGFDLSGYKGRAVTLYTYTITNYDSNSECIVADMLVCDGALIGGDVCNTSASDGFIVGFNGE